jgi:hypothetical protein
VVSQTLTILPITPSTRPSPGPKLVERVGVRWETERTQLSRLRTLG